MHRRTFLAAAAGIAAAGPAVALTRGDAPLLSEAIASTELTLGARVTDHTGVLQRLLDDASTLDRTVTLPAGSFIVSELKLPSRTRLVGVPGATRLVFGSGGHMLFASRPEMVSIRGVTFDGAESELDGYVPGLLHIENGRDVRIEDCTFTGSSLSGLALDRCGGYVTRSRFRNCGDAGIRAIESTGLSITDNVVEDCGSAGIKVYRWTEGEDGTILTGNRIERIRADEGGTGQNGNGINVFRAASVLVANNRIADCTFSAIRANSASNVQIVGNNCLRSGDAAIFSEFAFEGAVISNNLVDRAAHGIAVVNFREGGRVAVVNGNVVRNLSTEGQYVGERGFGSGIAVEADTSVTGNVVENAPQYGISVGYGPYLRDVNVASNVIRNAGIGIAVSVVEGAQSTVITDNLISGSRRGAIVGMRWDETASGDLARAEAEGVEKFAHLQVERNHVS